MKRLVISLLLLTLNVGRDGLSAAEPEPEVIAAYLFHLAEYITWPEDKFATSTSPLVIGVLGSDNDPVVQLVIKQIEGGEVRGRALVVRHYTSAAKAREAEVLWISPLERQNIADDLETLKGAGVLTISTDEGFVDKGGIVELWLHDQKMRFKAINNTAALKQNLKISSEVLRLAESVK